MNIGTCPFKKKSILFAPMEGITDATYRYIVMQLYPEWDRFCTDFLRIPSSGHYTDKKIIEHFGNKIFSNQELKNKTAFQVLTSTQANNEYTIKQIEQLGIDHIDLNIGCPSKKVNSHKGGAYLLSCPNELKNVLSVIRKNFSKNFTVKMRIGYRDDTQFEESLKIIQEEGANAVILHARTRDQLYKGVADWRYIKSASKLLDIPLIGNGDIWNKKDVEKIYQNSDCYGVMIARGATKTPWLAKMIKDDLQETLEYRKVNLIKYFDALKEGYLESEWDQEQILKRFKGLSRYLFDDFEDGAAIKSRFLRTKELTTFEEKLKAL